MSGFGRVLVVTGTDTGVGKTVATAALAAAAIRHGLTVAVVKPLQAGTDDGTDAVTVARLAGCDVHEFRRLEDPLAPDTAARLRGVTLPPVTEYAAPILELAARHDLVIVEGAGGLLVRLDTDGGTLPDLVLALDAARPEIVLVTREGLGTLSHTELTLEALRTRGIDPLGLVIGSAASEPGLAAGLNHTELPRVTGLPVLATLPDGAGSLAPAAFAAAVDGWISAEGWDRLELGRSTGKPAKEIP